MANNYVSEGEVVQHTAAAALTAGVPFVLGKLLAVPLVDLAIGETGSVAIGGVYDLPKVSAAVIAQGDTVNFDVSAGAIDDNLATPATGDHSVGCIAIEPGVNAQTLIKVKLNVAIGTVT